MKTLQIIKHTLSFGLALLAISCIALLVQSRNLSAYQQIFLVFTMTTACGLGLLINRK